MSTSVFTTRAARLGFYSDVLVAGELTPLRFGPSGRLSKEAHAFLRDRDLEWCPKCQTVKPLAEVSKSFCKSCHKARRAPGNPNYDRQRQQSRESARRWNQAHPDESRIHQGKRKPTYKAWRNSHPDAQRAISVRQNAKRRSHLKNTLREPYTKEDLATVLDFYGGKCAYLCGQEFAEWDHVVPLAKGGADAVWNLVPACTNCNRKKHASIWSVPNPHPSMKERSHDLQLATAC